MDPAARRAIARTHVQPADFSLRDRNAIAEQIRDKGYASLSGESRWRWQAYVRVWRKHLGLTGPSPTDESVDWRDDELDRFALAAWRERYPSWGREPQRKTIELSAKHREAADARDAWARECGFEDFSAAMRFGLVAADKRRHRVAA